MKKFILIITFVFSYADITPQENKIPVINFLELSTGLDTKGNPNLQAMYWIRFERHPRWNLNFSFLKERDFEELVFGGSYSFLKSKEFYRLWNVSIGLNIGDFTPGIFCSRFFLKEEIQLFEFKNYREKNSYSIIKRRPVNLVFYQTVCSDWKSDIYFRFDAGVNIKLF